jgi:hypothetical protein
MNVEIDFEGTQQPTVDNVDANHQKDDAPDINGGTPDVDNLDTKEETQKDKEDKPDTNDKQESESTEDVNLVEGQQIEYDGNVYTVDSNGNLVDSNNSVFKKADEIKDWLSNNNVETSEEASNEMSLSNIQEIIGVTIKDENDKDVEFTNDAKGVASYVNSVIELKANEIREGAINKLYNDNPLLKQFVDYVELNGSPKGFADIPDRSKITIEKDNDAQQVAIIKMASDEFGLNISNNYLKYLKDNDGLYDEAKTQLKALIDHDKRVQKEMSDRAAAKRQQEEANLKSYWEGVNNVINNRVIAGYKLPESFVKEVNGKKVTLTPNDFYDYLSRPSVKLEDGNVITQYQNDLSRISPEEALNKELLDAWLTFTGSSYKDLVNLAVKEDNVRKLIVKSKQNANRRTIKVIKPNTKKVNIDDIVL